MKNRRTLGLLGAVSTINLCILSPSSLGSPGVCQAQHWALGIIRAPTKWKKGLWPSQSQWPTQGCQRSVLMRCSGYNYIRVWHKFVSGWHCPQFVIQAMPIAQILHHEGLILARDGTGRVGTEGTAPRESQNNWDWKEPLEATQPTWSGWHRNVSGWCWDVSREGHPRTPWGSARAVPRSMGRSFSSVGVAVAVFWFGWQGPCLGLGGTGCV